LPRTVVIEDPAVAEEAAMPTTRTRAVRLTTCAAAVALALVTASAAGCAGTASSAASKVQSAISSAVSSAASQAESGASSLASKAAGQASSAISSAFAAISGGVDATGDVRVGPVAVDSDGKASTEVTVTNSTADQHSYTISVSFVDSGGAIQDAAVLTVSDVPGHGTKTATAKSNRSLGGALQAKVAAAVRI
jgi:hypothetical protein